MLHIVEPSLTPAPVKEAGKSNVVVSVGSRDKHEY